MVILSIFSTLFIDKWDNAVFTVWYATVRFSTYSFISRKHNENFIIYGAYTCY
jgi:hypothetical protein